jgi:hypothetical protein
MSTKTKCNIPPNRPGRTNSFGAIRKLNARALLTLTPRSTAICLLNLDSFGTLALRLPEKEREEFLEKYKTTLFEAYGAVMKEYVTVPDSLLKNTKELRKYLDMSYGYLKTLKPKLTKKKS